MNGYVSNIQRLSINDGEGIRTTIFLSGCPLRCQWCSNPDTWESKDEKNLMSSESVLAMIQKDIRFFRNSGGGVTFSGGEPSCQHQFVRFLLKKLEKYGLDTAIETCGYFQWSTMEDILKRIDFIFVDIKHMDSKIHKQITGVDNDIILKNIKQMYQLNKEIVVRIPLIKGVNDSAENIKKTVNFIKQCTLKGKIELLPYHHLGVYKYDKLHLEHIKPNFTPPSSDTINTLLNIINDSGVKCVHYK